jgi:hypothetical protein
MTTNDLTIIANYSYQLPFLKLGFDEVIGLATNYL